MTSTLSLSPGPRVRLCFGHLHKDSAATLKARRPEPDSGNARPRTCFPSRRLGFRRNSTGHPARTLSSLPQRSGHQTTSHLPDGPQPTRVGECEGPASPRRPQERLHRGGRRGDFLRLLVQLTGMCQDPFSTRHPRAPRRPRQAVKPASPRPRRPHARTDTRHSRGSGLVLGCFGVSRTLNPGLPPCGWPWLRGDFLWATAPPPLACCGPGDAHRSPLERA